MSNLPYTVADKYKHPKVQQEVITILYDMLTNIKKHKFESEFTEVYEYPLVEMCAAMELSETTYEFVSLIMKDTRIKFINNRENEPFAEVYVCFSYLYDGQIIKPDRIAEKLNLPIMHIRAQLKTASNINPSLKQLDELYEKWYRRD